MFEMPHRISKHGFLVVLFFITVSLKLISASADDQNPQFRSEVQVDQRREPKQLGFFQWLFGPAIPHRNSTGHHNVTIFSSASTIHPYSKKYLENHHEQNSLNTRKKNRTSEKEKGELSRSEIVSYKASPETSTSVVSDGDGSRTSNSNSNSFSQTEEILPFGPIFAKPRSQSSPTNFNSTAIPISTKGENGDNFRNNLFRNSKQIQISDVQHAIGSEIDSSMNSDSDPSQLNLQEELDAIDRLERNLTGDESEISPQRIKRQSTSTSSRFRQLSIPYGVSASSNNRINTLSKRQLLLSPAEQHMLALRQQQDLAAATMLQQQQLNRMGNRNRYYNRYDDYYDDSDSYEDSDEFFDEYNINRYGLHNPLAESMRRGIIPSLHHPMGLGRRSVPEDPAESKSRSATKGKTNPENVQVGVGESVNAKRPKANRDRATAFDSFLGPISKEGRWDTIEDYDMSSDFNKVKARRGKPARGYGESGTAGYLGESHKELDEEDQLQSQSQESDDDGEMFADGKGRSRSSLGQGLRQGDPDATTTTPEVSPDTVEPTGETMMPSESSETTIQVQDTTPVPAPEETTVAPSEATSIDANSPSTAVAPTTSKPTPSTTKKPRPKPTNSSTTPKPHPLPPYKQNLNCRCGMQSVRGHEIGDGMTVRTMVNPWLVAVRNKNKHLCSGSIINNKYILTSKSCVNGMKGLLITAGMGSRATKNFTVINVNGHKSRNLALLKIKPAIAPNHAMRPVCLPIKMRSQERLSPATGILVTFKRNSRRSSRLQLVQTEVPLLSSSKCTNTVGDFPSSSICHGPPGTMVQCGGDSGGLLQAYQQGYSYEQIGVVSNTVGCRANKTPGIYTDVRKSVKWILYNTKDARYCRKPKVTPHDLMHAVRVGLEAEAEESEELQESEEVEEDQDQVDEDEVEEQWGWNHNHRHSPRDTNFEDHDLV